MRVFMRSLFRIYVVNGFQFMVFVVSVEGFSSSVVLIVVKFNVAVNIILYCVLLASMKIEIVQ